MVYHDDDTESYNGFDPYEDDKGEDRAYHSDNDPRYSRRAAKGARSRSGPSFGPPPRASTFPSTNVPHGQSGRGHPNYSSTGSQSGGNLFERHLKETEWAKIANSHIGLPPPFEHQSVLSARSKFKVEQDGSHHAAISVHRGANSTMQIDLASETFTALVHGRARDFNVPDTRLLYKVNTMASYNPEEPSTKKDEEQWLANLTLFQALHEMYPELPQPIKVAMSKDALQQARDWRRAYGAKVSRSRASRSVYSNGPYGQSSAYVSADFGGTRHMYPPTYDYHGSPQYGPAPSSGCLACDEMSAYHRERSMRKYGSISVSTRYNPSCAACLAESLDHLGL
ncbi:hypothetical protein I204_01408 [Kwoniella mangroviensis CBS 8886]|nr:hypothetical protein I204_01408 [Kwoniella mangroviensis CBS 8886]